MDKDIRDSLLFSGILLFAYILVPSFSFDPEYWQWFEVFPYGILTFLMCLIFAMIPHSNKNVKYLIAEAITICVLASLLMALIYEPPTYILAWGEYSTTRFTAAVWMAITIAIGVILLAGCVVLLIAVGILKFKEHLYGKDPV